MDGVWDGWSLGESVLGYVGANVLNSIDKYYDMKK